MVDNGGVDKGVAVSLSVGVQVVEAVDSGDGETVFGGFGTFGWTFILEIGAAGWFLVKFC